MGQVERYWEWGFPATAAALWPALTDTVRFNEALGLPRYTVTDLPQADGTVRRIGTARRFGLTLGWDEGVPQWVAGRHFAHQRQFASGPLRRLATEIEIRPAVGGGSRVRYKLSLETRGWLGAVILRLGVLDRFGRALDRLFREAAEFAEGSRSAPTRPRRRTSHPPIRQRVEAEARSLADEATAPPSGSPRISLSAAESDVERMRPRGLARQWGLPPRDVIETCLAAAREGLLVLRWDLLCPRCRGAKVSVASLDQLPQGAHCPSCNMTMTATLPAMSRSPSTLIRVSVPWGSEPTASPARSPPSMFGYSVCRARRSPGGARRSRRRRISCPHRGARRGGRLFGRDGRVPEIGLTDAGPVIGSAEEPAGRVRLRNNGKARRTLVIEERAWAKDALTAHEVTAMQAFRDLFAEAVLRPGDQVEIRRDRLFVHRSSRGRAPSTTGSATPAPMAGCASIMRC